MTFSIMAERCYAESGFVLSVFRDECCKLTLYAECHYANSRGTHIKVMPVLIYLTMTISMEMQRSLLK
jgi:hypothetical protein